MKKDEMQAALTAAEKKIGDLEKEITALKAAQPDAGAEKTETAITLLKMSCADHCPHHADKNACKNCTIFQTAAAAGIDLTKE